MRLAPTLGLLALFALVCAIMSDQIGRGAWWQWLLISGVLLVATVLASGEDDS